MAATALAVSSPSSSPFRESHRRTRSHSSLSSPSSSPVHRQHFEQWRLPQRRAARGISHSRTCNDVLPVTPHFAKLPPEKWDVDMWRRGKRARRELASPSVVDTDMESLDDDEPMPLLDAGSQLESCDANHKLATTAIATSISSSSPPPMPHLPSSSSAFDFFPSKHVSQSHLTSGAARTVPVPASHVDSEDLSRMHNEAFTELRKTVAEAGEGFVRRMQEWEELRSRAEPSDALQTDSASISGDKSEREADDTGAPTSKSIHLLQKRGRKRPSPCSPSVSSRSLTATVKHIRQSSVEAQQDIDDDESDVEIYSSTAPQPGLDELSHSSPAKKRAVPLGGLEHCFNPSRPGSSPEAISPFAGIAAPKVRTSRMKSRRNSQRSSSPSDLPGSSISASSASSSDEDGNTEGISVTFGGAYRNRRRRSQRHHPHSPSHSRCSGSAGSIQSSATPPLSFSFCNSRNSSLTSLSTGLSSSMYQQSLDGFWVPDSSPPWQGDAFTGFGGTVHAGTQSPPPTASKSEKALAALTLAMANGAGSVSDYEPLRVAQGVLADEDGEASRLWD